MGFQRIVFRPNPVEGVDAASARFLSPRGRVSSEWKVVGRRMVLKLEVPCGAMARVVLPSAIRFEGRAPKGLVAGRYEFELAVG